MNEKINEIKTKIIEARESVEKQYATSELAKKFFNAEVEVIDLYGIKGELTFDLLTQLHKDIPICMPSLWRRISYRCHPKGFYNIEITKLEILEKAKEGNKFAQELLVCSVDPDSMSESEYLNKIQGYADYGWTYAIDKLTKLNTIDKKLTKENTQ